MIDENILKTVLTRIEKLEEEVFGGGEKKKRGKVLQGNDKNDTALDFSVNERAFAKRYIIGKSGPKKFTLLVAFLAQGKENVSVEFASVKKLWDRMSSKKLLGSFNRFYSSEAKTNGWVDAKEHGMYVLTKEWKKCL